MSTISPPRPAPSREEQLLRRIAELERRLDEYERGNHLAPAITPQHILNAIPVPVFYKDAQGIYLGCNTAFEHYLGRTRDEIVGHTVYDLAPADLAERYHEADISLMQQGTRQSYEAEVSVSDGTRHHVIFDKAVFHFHDGAVAGMVGTILDITQRKRAEEELRASRHQISQFLDALPLGVFVIDTEQRLVYANRLASELLQVDLAARAEAHLPFDSSHLVQTGTSQPYPAEQLPLMYALRGESHTISDLELRRAGDSVPLRMSAVPIRDVAGQLRFALVMVADITDELRAAEALRLRLQQEELIAAQSAALQEISTPLLAISDGVVLMPLIGAIDSQRAQHIVEILLEGVSAQRANVAIIDITGVSVVDTQVANVLVQAAQAAMLLGARVVLTGIRPEVAQALVGLGINLGSIVTRGTLQSGIAFALARR